MSILHVLEIKSPEQLRGEIEKIGADPNAVNDIAAKEIQVVLKVERAKVALARFLFQELTMEGGAAVMKPHLWQSADSESDVLLIGTQVQLQHLVVRLATQRDEELEFLAEEIDRALSKWDD